MAYGRADKDRPRARKLPSLSARRLASSGRNSITPRALVTPMRLHAAALAALLLTAPAALLWPDASSMALTKATSEGPLDPHERPPPMSRFDDTFPVNDTRVRAPTLPSWPASEPCVFVHSWGGSTIVRGGITAVWKPAAVGGAEVMTLRVEAPDGLPREITGTSPLALVLDGVALHETSPTKVTLRAFDPEEPFIRQTATIQAGWDMAGGPVALTSEGCHVDDDQE